MNAPFSYLLACLLFAHAVFGCCWHHAHDDDAPNWPPQCHHGHGHEETDCDQPGKECPCQAVCAGVCQFVPTKKVEIELPSWSQALFVAEAARPAFSQPALSGGGWQPERESATPLESLRLHLLHQIFLI